MGKLSYLRVIFHNIRVTQITKININQKTMTTNYSGKTRIESDLIGEMEVPVEALYGVQT